MPRVQEKHGTIAHWEKGQVAAFERLGFENLEETWLRKLPLPVFPTPGNCLQSVRVRMLTFT